MNHYEQAEAAVQYVADYWVKRKWTFLNQANEEFVDFVDPAAYYKECLTQSEIAMLNMCFTEWVLFERPLRRGRTPLQLLIDMVPADMPDGAADILRQIDDTQLFSRFAILHKDLSTGMATLRDVRTDKRYEVHAPHICEVEHWDRGSIGVRIACVDDAWQVVGRVHMYDHADADAYVADGPGEMHPEDFICKPEAEFASFYLRLARDVLGIDGRYHETARAREAAA